MLRVLYVVILLACLQGILNQGCYGHWAYAARYRGDVRGTRCGIFINHVANHFAVFQTVNPDVHDNRPFLNPFPGNEARLTDRDDQQIGILDVMTQVLVKRWVTVVVQPASSSSMLIGRPTMLEAPMTTAFSP